jgi:anhydro-N-acetylmuramic acid kinase
MRAEIALLNEISLRSKRRIVGLMSGTSLDGLDIALCDVSNHGTNTKVELLAYETIPYTAVFKENVRAVFAKQTIDLQQLTLLHAWIGGQHATMIKAFLKKHDPAKTVNLIASHGQTVYHAPQILHGKELWPNATLQIGDADHIAHLTGIITVSDFRQKHVAAGGEGAPLALYGDYLLFAHQSQSRILLNIGGIANFTLLPAGANAQKCFVTDTGPGNTLIDAFTRHFFSELSFDKNAEIAKSGMVDSLLMEVLLSDDFFRKPFPKTTGPELFSKQYVLNAIEKAGIATPSPANLLATLTKFTAQSIAAAIDQNCSEVTNATIYVSGGGGHNPLIVKYLEEYLPQYNLQPTEALGINPDAKEAILFAVLANECISGEFIDFGKNLAMPSVSFGKISLPN